MSYTVNWYIPNEIIYAHYSGIVTGDEMRECLSKMHELMNSSPRQLIHAISDIGDVIENVPFKDSMKIVREVGHHPKSGWMITVHEKSHVVKMGSAIAASVFRLRFRAFDNMDQVIAHLKNYDNSLSWDKVNLSIYSVKALNDGAEMLRPMLALHSFAIASRVCGNHIERSESHYSGLKTKLRILHVITTDCRTLSDFSTYAACRGNRLLCGC